MAYIYAHTRIRYQTRSRFCGNNFAIETKLAKRDSSWHILSSLIVRNRLRPKFHKHWNIAKRLSFDAFFSFSFSHRATSILLFHGEVVISGGESSMEKILSREDLNPLFAPPVPRKFRGLEISSIETRLSISLSPSNIVFCYFCQLRDINHARLELVLRRISNFGSSQQRRNVGLFRKTYFGQQQTPSIQARIPYVLFFHGNSSVKFPNVKIKYERTSS